jgi:CRP/FNR family transcriptional regulator, cyclic AMP receptor protein
MAAMDAATATGILNQNPWFAGLPRVLAKDIVRIGKVRRVKNTVVFAVGDEPNGLFAVLSGNVHISHTSVDGRLALLLKANAGNWFGETSVLDGHRRYSEALAVGPCDLLQLNMGDFRRLTAEHVSHYAAFVRLLCDHHRLAMDHLASLGSLPVSVRLAQRLLFFSRVQQSSGNLAEIVGLSQQELASVVGVSRQALSSHLKQLERQGIISLGYRAIKLRRRAVLEEMVNGAAISRSPRN